MYLLYTMTKKLRKIHTASVLVLNFHHLDCYYMRVLCLMKCEFVSQSGHMEPISSLCECILKNGHRCGACHNVSDAKVSTRELFVS